VVVWTGPARLDLKAIYDYIKMESVYYATVVAEEIIELSESLEFSPQRGRVVPEFSEDNVRELFIYSYRLIYEITDSQTVIILAVIHGRRNIDEITLTEFKNH